LAKKVKYKLLNGVVIEGKNIKRIIELIGDRIFIPEHCNPNNYDYNKHFKHLLSKNNKIIKNDISVVKRLPFRVKYIKKRKGINK